MATTSKYDHRKDSARARRSIRAATSPSNFKPAGKRRVEFDPFEEALGWGEQKHHPGLGLDAGPQIGRKTSLFLGRDEQMSAGSDPRPGMS
jgi:hypothetical protein